MRWPNPKATPCKISLRDTSRRSWPPSALSCLGGCVDAKTEPASPAPTIAPPAMVPGPAGKPLEPGSALPRLTAEGWLNGDPPTPGTKGVRLIVVDLWAHWCPFCKQGAPGLVQLFQKYHEKGVAFVSLTNMKRESVQEYVGQQSIPWSSGYGMDAATMVALGVNSGMPMPGYGVAPTLYLVDRHGRVSWCDHQGRFHHKVTADWLKDVDGAIAAALLTAE